MLITTLRLTTGRFPSQNGPSTKYATMTPNMARERRAVSAEQATKMPDSEATNRTEMAANFTNRSGSTGSVYSATARTNATATATRTAATATVARETNFPNTYSARELGSPSVCFIDPRSRSPAIER